MPPRSKAAPGSIMSSRVLMAKKYDTYGFFGKFRTLFGDPEVGFATLIHGQPGHGKSSLAIQFARYLADHHGPVLYASSEQYDSASLQDNLKRAGGAVDGLDFSKRIPGDRELGQYAFLIVDSVFNLGMTAKDVEHLRDRHPRLGVVLIQQVTKTGTYKGATTLAHDVDVQVEVVEGRASAIKNRFGPLAAIQVFQWTGETKKDRSSNRRKNDY